MSWRLEFADEAAQAIDNLQRYDERRHRKVQRALGRLQENPRHPGLASHQYESFPADPKVKIWESYVENNTPSAWRIFWRYGPDTIGEDGGTIPVITIVAITPHP